MKRIALLALCPLMLAACAAQQKQAPEPAKAETPMEITGSAGTSMSQVPMVQTDPDVTVYPLDGPVQNPMTVDRTHGVLDNTTAGGYTVFDDSVKVYPLPGEDTPTYVPDYAVPPLKDQYKPEAPAVGTPMGLASAGTLPPVPNVDIGEADPFASPPKPGVVRRPLTLTAPEPLTMQPPASVQAPLPSPFSDQGNDGGRPRGPMLTGDDSGVPVLDQKPAAPVMAGPADTTIQTSVTTTTPSVSVPSSPPSSAMTPGRRSGPGLTGY
ncbi:MAG: hypothetical protein H6865_06425 [Rhodospirillales bacterium]|nr:hypothetical protein [Alphaproteobacteria bacterium]MCB9987257.1 hypothetical protein [Rhodospirillales bacterium]USO07883.1 MAG: hypothetical protein H6866_01275 [Rhodospirillales bacterium]